MNSMIDNKLNGASKTLSEQIDILETILFENKKLKTVLTILSQSNLKNYYVAAGCVNQTVFNYYHNNDMDFGIEDFDIVYFDEDLSYEKEDAVIKYVTNLLKDIDIKFDIKNEARVHLWYGEKYGKNIEPYTSVENAISSWGTSITCIGVRLEEDKLIVCAPYGLSDLFNMTIRPIKKQFTKERYQIKTSKWKNKWPQLNVLPWDE